MPGGRTPRRGHRMAYGGARAKCKTLCLQLRSGISAPWTHRRAGAGCLQEGYRAGENVELPLRGNLDPRPIFPAVDVAPSSTREEDRLLPPPDLRTMAILRPKLAALPRREMTEQVIHLFEKTSSN